ncbi:rsmB [Symbiodinium pilosum]|uniref:RsmB protein n=1 Tax=Symbiodinium pilosum TaxID=2952 RepID=A0A812N7B3_SYMPI|nr:rsmB [Symbiodinium pilosum]
MGGIRRRGQRSHKQDEAGRGGEAVPLNEARAVPKRSRSAAGIKPDAAEVLQCIETLYVDKLKPFGRILRKRVAERHVQIHLQQQPYMPGTTIDLPDVDIKHLKQICEESDMLDIAPEEGGDWSATFRGRSQVFVDIYSPTDEHALETWQAAREYFDSLPESEALLPGGRYSCAQALVQRNLPFLGGFSLGEVCHLVQLAISKHKILGYCNGAVVPYSRSQSRVKEECAESQQPCLHAPKEDQALSLALASLEKARSHLREILISAEVPGANGPSMIPLSNVKRLFRSRYQIELSETALGHSKLSDLLQDPRFSDICEVQLQGQGYIVVQAQAGPDDKEVPGCYTGGPIASKADASESQRTLGSLASLAVDCALTPVIDSSKYDSRDLGPARESCRPFCVGEPLALEEAGFDRLPPGLADREVKNTFIHSAVTPLVTPEPGSFRRSQSVPKDVGFACADMDKILSAGHETCSVAPSPAFLPPPTPSSPLYSRGYEALLLSQMEQHPLNTVIRLADLI